MFFWFFLAWFLKINYSLFWALTGCPSPSNPDGGGAKMTEDLQSGTKTASCAELFLLATIANIKQIFLTF